MRRQILALAGGILLTAGCLEDRDPCCPVYDTVPPLPPVGVTSVTGDHSVSLCWYPNQEPDLDGYRVYLSREPYGPYAMLGFTSRNEYEHRAPENGVTYYYGVTAIDVHGNESDLNDEVIYDTPRPEGRGLTLFEADGQFAGCSGYDFSRYRRMHWDAPEADLFYDVAGDVPYLVVPDYATDIQDAGYLHFDDITWAPEGGWSETGFLEAIPGHVYVVWTRDNHYAKVRVVEVDPRWVVLDWAYQEDRGNPELLRSSETGRRTRPGAVEEGGAS